MATPPVSVVLAARDAERTVADAVGSVLEQTFRDFELVVVDDGSVDRTAAILGGVEDDRLRVVRNDQPLGLAGALNVGFDAARGSLLARMDADDIALPEWLERVVGRIRSTPAAVVGAAMIDFHEDGSLGTIHFMPTGARAVRWAALFSSPFFHSTLVVDRVVLDAHGLRYDTAFGESEDYDLWARLLSVAKGDNIPKALVLYRQHGEQASARRAMLQRECQREVALRQIAELAPGLDPGRAELAWLTGAGVGIPEGSAAAAAAALGELVSAFEDRHGGRDARRAAAWAVLRSRGSGADRSELARLALRLDPTVPLYGAARLRRRRAAGRERRAAERWLRTRRTDGPVRLTMVIPEPTPFRTVMFDRIAERPELDLTALYAGGSVQRRTWTIEPNHRAVFLEGVRIPGAYRVLRHEYPVSLGVFEQLRRARPDVVVVSGWSTFASQAAAEWCRRRDVPYVLLVESNERDARPGWRRTVKEAMVPRMVAGAAEVLVVGRLAREAMLARGVPPERISLFADTIDAERFGREADRLAARRDELRAAVGVGPADVAVLCVARLAPEKGQDTLVRAAAEAQDPRLVLLLAGSGDERDRLVALADELGVRLVLLPDLPWQRIVERFALADVFALLSRHEPWGVVVNEAAACGLPLVLSDRVGAAFDLLEDGRNGTLVPVDDHVAAGAAIRALAGDPERRHEAGEASRAIMRGWGYEPSIENLIRVAERVARRRQREPRADA